METAFESITQDNMRTEKKQGMSFIKKAISKLPRMPIAFLGFGLHRAWIEIAFVGSFIEFPANHFNGHNIFDFSILAVALICVATYKKLGTLYDKRSLHWVCGITLVLSTIGLFASLWYPNLASTLAIPSAILGGTGIALLILFWSELYCCLNPVRVALYFCASIAFGAIVIYIYRGFYIPWLFVAMIFTPLASLACLKASFNILLTEEAAKIPIKKSPFPWKPVFLMALFAFAYGLKESSLYASSFGPHSAFGTLAMATIVFLGVVFQGGKFDFRVIYRFALPLMIGTFLILPTLGFLDNTAANFCITGAYTAFSILIMIILTSLSYHCGVSPILLFGTERAVRVLFNMLGRQAEIGISNLEFSSGFSSDFILNALVILLVTALTMMLLSGKDLSSRWGGIFFKKVFRQRQMPYT